MAHVCRIVGWGGAGHSGRFQAALLAQNLHPRTPPPYYPTASRQRPPLGSLARNAAQLHHFISPPSSHPPCTSYHSYRSTAGPLCAQRHPALPLRLLSGAGLDAQHARVALNQGPVVRRGGVGGRGRHCWQPPQVRTSSERSGPHTAAGGVCQSRWCRSPSCFPAGRGAAGQYNPSLILHA